MKTSLARLFLIFPFYLLLSNSAFPQGSLTPPGAPAPTMKTLDQVEARTPIAGGTTPFAITAPGSYYLTGNLSITGGTVSRGITVGASNVSIDLNGFDLVGSGVSTSGAGIYINGGISNVSIRNGTIRNWGAEGINGGGNANVRAENLRVLNNGSTGILADVNGEILNCIVESNVGAGITGANNCMVKDSQAISTTGTNANGISVGDGSAVTACVARGNAGAGIAAGVGCIVSGCTVFSNNEGIKALASCFILSNNCANNFLNGIHTTSGSNRIDDNNLVNNSNFGIRVDGTSSFIVRNTVTGSGGADYYIAANNQVGFIVLAPNSAAIFGGTGGKGVGTSDPWANFLY